MIPVQMAVTVMCMPNKVTPKMLFLIDCCIVYTAAAGD